MTIGTDIVEYSNNNSNSNSSNYSSNSSSNSSNNSSYVSVSNRYMSLLHTVLILYLYLNKIGYTVV